MQDINRLVTLIAVAETGSISRAAARLGYTPPALSQQLAKLEREVGVPLLVRHRRGVRLTPAGEVLLSHAHRILSEVDRARDALSEMAGLSGGRVRIASFGSGGSHLLPPVLAEFGTAHPAVQLTLHEMEPPAALATLVDGGADFVLVHDYQYGPRLVVPATVACEIVAVEEMVLIGAPGHELTKQGASLRWTELVGRHLISSPAGVADRTALEALFRERSLAAPSVAYETSNYWTSMALASVGVAVALVPRQLAELSPFPLSIRPLAAPGFHRKLGIAWRARETSAGVHALRAAFRRAFGAHEAPAVAEAMRNHAR
jgi:DNA-binding transcriptional LysR family regulator